MSDVEKLLAKERINKGIAEAEDYKLLGMEPPKISGMYGEDYEKEYNLKPSEYLIQLMNKATGNQLSDYFTEKFVNKKGLFSKKSKFQKDENLQNSYLQSLIREMQMDELNETHRFDKGGEDTKQLLKNQLDSMLQRTGEGMTLQFAPGSSPDLSGGSKKLTSLGTPFDPTGRHPRVHVDPDLISFGLDDNKKLDQQSSVGFIPKQKSSSKPASGSNLGSSLHGTGSNKQSSQGQQSSKKQQRTQSRRAQRGSRRSHHYSRGGGVRTTQYTL